MNTKQYLWAIKMLRAAYKMKLICGFPASGMAAMTIFETGYGGNVPTDILDGKYSYNLFGVKCLILNGKVLVSGNNGCALCYTHEERNGQRVLEKHYFRAYKNYQDSFLDYVNVLKVSKDDDGNQRYRKAFDHLDNAEEFVTELWKAGYATDSKYIKNITPLIRQLNKIPTWLLKL